MKFNAAIAVAILAYCAGSAPVTKNSTAETSPALPSEPIPLIVSTSGVLEPQIPTKPDTRSRAGDLEDFPMITEGNHRNENETYKSTPLGLGPFGRGSHRPFLLRNPMHTRRSETDNLDDLFTGIIREDKDRKYPRLDDFFMGIIRQDSDENKVEKHYRTNARPFGRHGHGPVVVHPRPEDLQEKNKIKTETPHHPVNFNPYGSGHSPVVLPRPGLGH